MIVMAYEDEAESVDDIVEKTGIAKKRVYELKKDN